ncbi:MAG: transposase [Chitinophagales bacterium]
MNRALIFFKSLINRLLALQLNSIISSVQLDLPFKDIQLLDSTYIKLPDCMSKLFPGTGKKGGKETGNSGYKWHLEYRFLSGDFIGVITCKGTENDAKQSDTHLEEGKIESGILYIRDLGYYNIGDFEKIDQAGASF